MCPASAQEKPAASHRLKPVSPFLFTQRISDNIPWSWESRVGLAQVDYTGAAGVCQHWLAVYAWKVLLCELTLPTGLTGDKQMRGLIGLPAVARWAKPRRYPNWGIASA